jgi:hypothetical protein
VRPAINCVLCAISSEPVSLINPEQIPLSDSSRTENGNNRESATYKVFIGEQHWCRPAVRQGQFSINTLPSHSLA